MNEKELARLSAMWELENECFSRGCRLVCGVDEAGRGPLAGDVFAAAVILPPGYLLEGLNDSKKVSPKKREKLYESILRDAICCSVGRAAPEEIDAVNILNATFLAMHRAVYGLNPLPDFVLVDGNRIRGIDIDCRCVVKGDSLSCSIAAASILAKVERDRYIEKLDETYPGYGLAQHKGYPTRQHYAAIREKGILPIHRKSFLKNL